MRVRIADGKYGCAHDQHNDLSLYNDLSFSSYPSIANPGKRSRRPSLQIIQRHLGSDNRKIMLPYLAFMPLHPYQNLDRCSGIFGMSAWKAKTWLRLLG